MTVYYFTTTNLAIWSLIMVGFGLAIGQWVFDMVKRAFIMRLMLKKNYGIIRMFMGDRSERSIIADLSGSIIRHKNRAYFNDSNYVYIAEDYSGTLGANEMAMLVKYDKADEETKKSMLEKFPILKDLLKKTNLRKQKVKYIRSLFGVPIMYFNYDSATPIDIESGSPASGYDNPEKIATALETDIEAEVMDRLSGREKRREIIQYLILGGVVLLLLLVVFRLMPQMNKILGFVVELIKSQAGNVGGGG